MRCFPVLAALVVLGALTGCGSSAPKGVNFHSAGRQYTVKQVEEAFAAEGIRLHSVANNATNPPTPGFVVLQSGHGAHLVVTWVHVSATSDFTFATRPMGVRIQREGNIAAYFHQPSAQSVRTALSRLH